MDVKVKVKVDTIKDVLTVLDTLNTEDTRKDHPNVKLIIEVASDAD